MNLALLAPSTAKADVWVSVFAAVAACPKAQTLAQGIAPMLSGFWIVSVACTQPLTTASTAEVYKVLRQGHSHCEE